MKNNIPKELKDDRILEEDINLFELVAILWDGKVLVMLITGLAAICSIMYALSLPNIYESKALLSPKGGDGTSGLAGLARQYGGLASLAGINIGTGGGEFTKSMKAQQKIKSLDFFSRQLYEKILVELMAVDHWSFTNQELVYNSDVYDFKSQTWIRNVSYPMRAKPSAQEAHQVFLERLNLSEDKETSLIVISVKHQSPVVAQSWVNLIIEAVTEEVRENDIEEAQDSISFLERRRAETSLVSLDEVFAQLIEEQTKTIMLANVSDDYVFDVIDPPVVPEFKSEPKRTVICVLGTMFGGMLGVLLQLLRHYASGREIRGL